MNASRRTTAGAAAPAGPAARERPPRPRAALATLLLAATVAAPALPGWWGAAWLAGLAAGWLFLRPPRREGIVAGTALALALAALLAAPRLARTPDVASPAWQRAATARYAAAWQELAADAQSAREALAAADAAGGAGRGGAGFGAADGEEGDLAEDRAEAFGILDRLAASMEEGRGALLLVDPDGLPFAWAGEGLLHELDAEAIPRSGAGFEASFGAVTALVAAPLDAGRRPWRAIAARSFATDRLPFAPGWLRAGGGRGAGLRWSLLESAEAAEGGAVVLAPEGLPPLAVERGAGPVPAGLRAERDLRRVAWLALAAALLALGVMRGVSLAPAAAEAGEPGEVEDSWRPTAAAPARLSERAAAAALLGAAGAVSAALAAGAGLPALAVLLAGLAAGCAGAALGVGPLRPPSAGPVVPMGDRSVREAGGAADGAGPLAVDATARRPARIDAVGGGSDVAASARAGGRARAASLAPAAGAGAAVAAALALGAWAGQAVLAPLDLSARLVPGPDTACLRVALAAAAFGLLAAVAGRLRRREAGRAGDRRAWVAAGLLLAAAAAAELPWLALPLVAAGAAAAAAWAAGRPRWRPAVLAVLAVLAALTAAAAGETVHRRLLRADLVERVLPRMTPPAEADTAALAAATAAFFAGADLGHYLPRRPEGLEREDLAFLLWQASPLARPDALSALVVRPAEGPVSAFSFGVPLTSTGEVSWDPDLWRHRPLAEPRERAFGDAVTLDHRGTPWARLEWTLLPLPGFGLGGGPDLERVETALLRGDPARAAMGTLPEGVVYALYAADGRPLSSPWEEAPPLPASLAGSASPQRAVVDTPAGTAWAAASGGGPAPGGRAASPPSAGGVRAVLYLPVLGPREALERVGTHALGAVLAVAAAGLLALLLALPRLAFRDALRRAVRSYSKRLLIVYALLLLVPLLLLNAVLLASLEERLRREQRAAGERALAASQQVLGGYLASLEAGFDLASELDDDLLGYLSQIVRHEINLYWGSEVWASTKPELFTARLLPRRIPGEIYSRIALGGYDLASRTNRIGDTSYLELYAPLRIPGVPEDLGPRNFFLSMPLLAQQEEVARELAALRRRAVLVTAALVLLLAAVGVRLSRSFTRPLTELVEGTRRIAAGAPSLELAPTELELAALVEAIDVMARRIADARERLLREKQVVERIVEHITAGVVSLDREGRVLMRNRVAAELLGVEVGERLEEALAAEPRLAPVAGWLTGAPGGEPAQRTVRLPDPGRGEDGGEEREWTLVRVPVPGDGEPSALLVVEDATETLRGQRLEAWAEMARIIAHEIKNPLTPIRLNVEHLQQVWRDRLSAEGGPPAEAADRRLDEIFARCTGNVLAQVDELRQIASEFSTYSRIPKIDPRPGDLVEAMRDLAEPYRAAPPPGVAVEIDTPEGPLPARFDRRLLTRAVRNLIENALRASAGGGTVVVRVEGWDGAGAAPGGGRDGGPAVAAPARRRGTGEARIVVLDSGPGIAPALLPRIFDPYFSTHDTGTGLGLPIARRIAEEHGGTIAARNRPEGGLEVAITLPAG